MTQKLAHSSYFNIVANNPALNMAPVTGSVRIPFKTNSFPKAPSVEDRVGKEYGGIT